MIVLLFTYFFSVLCLVFFFFFKQKTAYEMRISDWSSDVCSSDLGLELSFRRLWTMRTQVFGVGAAELIGGGTLIALGLYLLGQPPAGAFGLGLALALSSTAVVLPMVGTPNAVGRAAFSMLLFEDLALVPIIFMLGALAPSVAARPEERQTVGQGKS